MESSQVRILFLLLCLLYAYIIIIAFIPDTYIFFLVSYGAQSCCSGISGRSTGDKTLYGITCSGQSGIRFIQDCSFSVLSGYSAGSCSLQSEMVVGCYESANCRAGDVRLVGGNSASEGRVELCAQGLWGAISTSSWDLNDARVVCRQLGLPWQCELKKLWIILNLLCISN